MDRTVRRFASWVLSMHVLLLGLLVILVAYATWEVYTVARQQALEQVRVRQELLASQAARGLAFFYRNVQDNLELLARSDTPDTLAPRVWEQLRGRATHLIELDLATGAVQKAWRDEERINLPDLVKRADAWLAPTKLTKPVITDALVVGDIAATLVAVPGWTTTASAQAASPSPAAGAALPVAAHRRAWVAVVPLLSIEARFLNDFNQQGKMGSLLVDANSRVMSADERQLIGIVLTDPHLDPRIREVAEESIRGGQRTTREFLNPRTIGSVTREPAMVTIQPVDLPDGQRWWLAVSSSLSDVDYAVARFFRRALIGAGVIIVAMTAILVSTSTTMIRSRLRLERMQREMLTRELDQAREIQLMWLPAAQKPATDDQSDGQNAKPFPLDIAAINRPASHVSGDFYNWFELPDGRICIVIGDVTGHGLPAAFLMSTTQLLVRAIIERVPDPGACLRETNRLLCEHVFSGQFVTLLVALFDREKNTLDLATAGHPAPVIGSGEGFMSLPIEPQLVLAIDGSVNYTTQRFDLPQGASMVLYTDGVTDVQNPGGERMGEDWLTHGLYGAYHRAQDLLDSILDSIDAFRKGREPADDLTLVAIQLEKHSTRVRVPGPAAPAALTPEATRIQ